METYASVAGLIGGHVVVVCDAVICFAEGDAGGPAG